jgi:hypothetical protein
MDARAAQKNRSFGILAVCSSTAVASSPSRCSGFLFFAITPMIVKVSNKVFNRLVKRLFINPQQLTVNISKGWLACKLLRIVGYLTIY